MSTRHLLCLAILSQSLVTTLHAEEPTASGKASSKSSQPGIAFFETKIRPVLVEHCYDCHSHESGSAEGGLRVDDRAALRAGGGRGPAVVPRRPEASILLTALAHGDADLKMPPKAKRLADHVLHDFRKWIEMGAPDPRDGNAAGQAPEWSGLKLADSFWAYQAPQQTAAPKVVAKDWPHDDIDRFILRQLEARQLAPSADARPHVLLRRVHFDLTGLPPSPADLDSFRAAAKHQGIDAALAAEVDRLLETAQFSEHWGRHWLDVARFGESSGKEANIPFPYAWRYRDYVIDSVNDDMPIDRFFTEQIAGDLLPFKTGDERARLLVATGFLAVGTKNLSERNDRQFQADIVDEQIDTLSRALMASSIACARCHDHKFDPFGMEDYYALAGIFASTKTFFGTCVSPASQQGGELIRLPKHAGQVVLHKSLSPKKADEMKQRLAALQAEKAEMDAARRAIFAGKKPERTFTLREVLANIWRAGPIVGRLQTIDDTGNAIPVSMGVMDRAEIRDSHLLVRGDINRPGDKIARALPRALQLDGQPTIPPGESGRRELAEWLIDRRHPLTSRVFVNRVWHHLFGAGLVRTVDDFGTTGAAPSHPKLLDTLAVQFMNDDWSLKRLVRRLVLTRTYRQASDYRQSAFLEDPENRLLWRMPKRRLPAEAIRDAMLAVSGDIDLARPAGSLVGRVILDKPISLIGLDKRLPKDLDGSVHRSVYLPVIRDRLPDVLELFDFAEPSLVTGNRETTNVPVQALYLMNSPFVQQRAQSFAAKLANETDTIEAQIDRAFRQCYGREPDQSELKRSLEFLRSSRDDELLMSFCQALLSTAEFRNVD